MLTLLTLVSIITIWSRNASNLISVRKRKRVTMVLLCISVVMLFAQHPVMSNGMFFMMAAIFISMALCNVKRTKLVDALMVIMMLAVIANQYLPLFGIML